MNGADRGEKILHFQGLYRNYSRLDLSNDHDRPVAISGLEDRVLKALDARGGFGIFDEEKPAKSDHHPGRGLLRRSLLWCRGTDVARLRPIEFLPIHAVSKVPSWSWMAYAGGIDYIHPDFGSIDWEPLDSPWYPEVREDSMTLTSVARDFHTEECHGKQCVVVLDDPGKQSKTRVDKCVILGTERAGKGSQLLSDAERKHYVLVVSQETTSVGEKTDTYQRVGAGYVYGRCLGHGADSVGMVEMR